ncbi:MAG TPA: molybdate ABC transporter substrate-binding protein [Methanoregula sp.]|nr:molybdate ABC transporter substrate-binding protein [Methanoregula sp.]
MVLEKDRITMKQAPENNRILPGSIVLGLLIAAILFAGCTSSTPAQSPVQTPAPVAAATTVPAPQETTVALPSAAATVPATATATPAPVYTASPGNLVVYTAASLTGASPAIGSAFAAAYPGHKVAFNLDGTQALKTQVESGAYADVFISASNSYTNTLKNEGYFINSTIHPLTTNYLILILPAGNPGKIQSLSDLAKPGIKIDMEAKEVPAGTVTVQVIGNLANSTYGKEWQNALYKNVVSYETSEPAVATKVSLGEADAGFVYESTYNAAPKDTLSAIAIPKAQNVLQTYTIGVLKESTNQDVATEFDQFMLSPAGQQVLTNYGFRPVS